MRVETSVSTGASVATGASVSTGASGTGAERVHNQRVLHVFSHRLARFNCGE